jgi:hypothetical protein
MTTPEPTTDPLADDPGDEQLDLLLEQEFFDPGQGEAWWE